MRFLMDANLPRTATQTLIDAGHEATDVRDIGLGGAPDAVIAQRAREQGFCLVTRDFDFSDVRNYPPQDCHGIIVLDLPDEAVSRQVCAVLSGFVQRTDLETIMPGRLAIVRSDRARFRPKLPE
jgi:predicted nuclease of predicted toxin-antitoxin system